VPLTVPSYDPRTAIGTAKEDVHINHLITTVVAEKMAALMALEFLE
jgi:hypothetical protein